MVPWNDNNESNDFVVASYEDDMDMDEDALTNDMTLGNILTIVVPTSYAQVPL